MSSKKRLSLKRKLVEKDEYELCSPLNFKDFKEFKMEKLVKMMRQCFHSDWQRLPWTEKYYHGCRQVFVKRVCKAGFSARIAFDIITTLEENKMSPLEDIVDFSVLYEIDNIVMILID